MNDFVLESLVAKIINLDKDLAAVYARFDQIIERFYFLDVKLDKLTEQLINSKTKQGLRASVKIKTQIPFGRPRTPSSQAEARLWINELVDWQHNAFGVTHEQLHRRIANHIAKDCKFNMRQVAKQLRSLMNQYYGNRRFKRFTSRVDAMERTGHMIWIYEHIWDITHDGSMLAGISHTVVPDMAPVKKEDYPQLFPELPPLNNGNRQVGNKRKKRQDRINAAVDTMLSETGRTMSEQAANMHKLRENLPKKKEFVEMATDDNIA